MSLTVRRKLLTNGSFDCPGYDIIGDVHGYLEPLRRLLRRMGYRKEGASFRHPVRKAVFVGDLVDSGPQILGVLDLAKRMVEEEAALMVIGNHEHLLLRFYTNDASGTPLIPHNEVILHQHSASIKQFKNHPRKLNEYLTWFRTLPLWLDLGSLRVVHACWDPDAMAQIKGRSFEDPQFLEDSSRHDSSCYEPVKKLLWGIRILDPRECTDGLRKRRSKLRLKWWAAREETSLLDLSFPKEEDMPTDLLALEEDRLKLPGYPKTSPPVFFGHYSLTAPIQIQAANVVCLDYSVKNKGPLVAYRWCGEAKVQPEHFVPVW